MKPYQIIVGILALPLAIGAYSLYTNVVTKPAQIINQATNATKMIQNYEWFYEAANNFNARTSQVRQYKALYNEETDKQEKQRLRVDMSAVQQSCRELAAKYEAQSGKIHVGYLKSNSLPESLNAKECE